MDKYQRLKGQRSLALFFLGCLLFNYPVLSLFSRSGYVLGIPILYVYLFISWAALIGLIAIIVEMRG
jgi:hypothetical protein